MAIYKVRLDEVTGRNAGAFSDLIGKVGDLTVDEVKTCFRAGGKYANGEGVELFERSVKVGELAITVTTREGRAFEFAKLDADELAAIRKRASVEKAAAARAARNSADAKRAIVAAIWAGLKSAYLPESGLSKIAMKGLAKLSGDELRALAMVIENRRG